MMVNLFSKYILGFTIAGALFSSCSLFEDDKNKPDPSRGLVTYYTFDNESADDISGKQCHGVLINNPKFITDSPNNKGKAIFINGIKEESVNIPYNLSADSTCYSTSFWLKDFTTGKIIASYDSGNSSAALEFVALAESRNFQFRTAPYNSGLHIFSNYNYSPIQQGEWHHIAIVVSEDETNRDLLLYIDGKLTDRQSWRYSGSNAIKFQIGNNSEGIVSFKLDNFRLYNRSITQEEVKMIYNSEKK